MTKTAETPTGGPAVGVIEDEVGVPVAAWYHADGLTFGTDASRDPVQRPYTSADRNWETFEGFDATIWYANGTTASVSIPNDDLDDEAVFDAVEAQMPPLVAAATVGCVIVDGAGGRFERVLILTDSGWRQSTCTPWTSPLTGVWRILGTLPWLRRDGEAS